MKKHLLISFFLISFIPAQAGINGDLEDFFKSMGSAVNATSASTYQDQAAGYYTGGGVFIRNSSKNIQPLTLQAPSYRAGCGGIDLHLGGMSFIKAQELLSALRAVGSAMPSYAFMLMMQTVSPQIYNTINELNAIAQKINQMNINTCEVTATTLGALWPRSDQASKHLCTAISGNLGQFSDWAASRQGCGAGGNRDSVLSQNTTKEEYKNMLVGEYNLAWKAIQQNTFLSADQEMAEFFMTLSGSLISRKTGAGDKAPFHVSVLPSLADHGDLINAILQGGQAKIWKCDTRDKCLSPKAAHVSVLKPLEGRVYEILDSMVNKVYEDEKLTSEELAFLNSTSLPIYKILNVTTAYQRGKAPIDIRDYSRLIAYDLLSQYLLEVLDIVTVNLNDLRTVQVDDGHIKRLLDGIHKVRERVVQRRTSVVQQLQSILSLIEKTSALEAQLFSTASMISHEKR